MAGRIVAFLPTGSWTRWREARVTVRMYMFGHQFAERNVIDFETTGRNGPNIDKITVVRPDWPRTLQAEDAPLVGAAALSTHGGFEGRGYADFIDPNSSIEWTVESQVAQQVAVTIRFANGSTLRASSHWR